MSDPFLRDGPRRSPATDLGSPLETLLRGATPHVVVIRSPVRSAGAELLDAMMRSHPGPGVVVVVPPEPSTGPHLEHTRSARELRWRVLSVQEGVVSITLTAAAMRLLHTLVRDADQQPSAVRPLWLPPSLLEAYSLLPDAPSPIVAVDNWEDLLQRYLRGGGESGNGVPTAEELERILLAMIDREWTVHLVVLTQGPRPVLEAGADLIVDLTAPPGEAGPSARPRILRGGRAGPVPTGERGPDRRPTPPF
jgi:hypothetical protein